MSFFIAFGSSPGSQELRWYKGNTHTHTINSDGDSTPDEVVRWYKTNGYHFVVISDHNFITEVDGLNSVFGAEEKFLVLRGEEVTDRFQDKPVHVNALNPNEYVEPQGGGSIVETIQRNVDAIRGVEGVPHINHPNFGWAITAEHLKLVQNDKLFEIYNGHPLVHNHGGGGHASLEEMWDDILSSGKIIYGIAVDDAHHFKGEFRPDRSNPGRGWIVVKAPELSAQALLEAMESGDFYASTGVELLDIEVTTESVEIRIRPRSNFRYTTYFIGRGGQVLQTEHGTEVRYAFSGDEIYVRARVEDSMGYVAWTQPVLPNPAEVQTGEFRED